MNAHEPARLLFLPGASGDTSFWHRAAALLEHAAPGVHVGWPGFGETPPERGVNSFDDLVRFASAKVDRPTAFIAQSMGGVVALRVALERPELVTHLVLTATSGGIDVAALGAADWRAALAVAKPTLPPWFATYRGDLTEELCRVTAPTLLLWGSDDPISPVAVGERLESLLPNARLVVLEAGTHDLACEYPVQVAALIDAHLRPPVR